MLGMEKSMRIRVLLDVRKPLKKHINLKMRGGFSNRVTVKYEKLPFFCFHCERLGDGTKDCDEFHGEGSPIKNFNGSLKASPWQLIRDVEVGDTNEGKSCCARKLFVVKSNTLPQYSLIKNKIEAMVEQLGGVDTGIIDQGDCQNVSVNSGDSLVAVYELAHQSEENLVHEEAGISSRADALVCASDVVSDKPVRKWKRRQRYDSEEKSSEVLNVKITGGSKRVNDSDVSIFL